MIILLDRTNIGSFVNEYFSSSYLFTHSVLTSMSALTTEMSFQQQTTALAKEVALKLSAPASFTIDELEAISTFFSQQIEALRESSAAATAAAAAALAKSVESTGETKEAPSNAEKGDLVSQAAALLQQRKDRLTVPTDVINLTKQIDTLNEPIIKLTADIQ